MYAGTSVPSAMATEPLPRLFLDPLGVSKHLYCSICQGNVRRQTVHDTRNCREVTSLLIGSGTKRGRREGGVEGGVCGGLVAQCLIAEDRAGQDGWRRGKVLQSPRLGGTG